MLPAKNRLKLPVAWNRRTPDYQSRGTYFKLLAKKAAGHDTKVGFVVTTKVGKATVRNRLRRKLSELIAAYLQRLPNWEVILIIYPSIVGASDEEISTSLDKALPKNTL